MPPFDLYRMEADGIQVDLDLGIGHIARFEVHRDGRRTVPFHRAPWADDPDPPAGTSDAPHLARISGDFLCAPFSRADVEAAPAHGWPANASWTPVKSRTVSGGGMMARFELEQHRVLGARVFKEFTLRDGHPFLYQRHVFEGGNGALPVANHAMVRLPEGGKLAFSPKRWVETPASPLETDPARGRFVLAYPGRSENLSSFPTAAGGSANLTNYPIGSDHEDFAMLVEAEGSTLGWSAVLRARQGDMALMLKDPQRLPVTMLWFSNGGRFYPPWNGRHRHVLGIEDGCSWFGGGHAASVAENPLSRAGVPTAIHLQPDGSVDVRHVIGAVPVPDGLGSITDIRAETDHLRVETTSGVPISLPYDASFLAQKP